jgi:predicted TIM-barrel fold metal-dependent hydrolase
MPPLLDTHQHLVYPDRLGYGWAAATPALAGQAFTLEDYREITRVAGVAGTIFMETNVDDRDYRKEVRLTAERMRRPESGILGIIASCRPETDDGFDAWLEEGRSLGVVGYRRILHETTDDVSQTATFRANVRKVGSRGLPFDLCFAGRQLPIALELVRACPDTAFVLDHCGGPDIAGGAWDSWARGVSDLAAMPNVTAKISGVFDKCAPGAATPATVRPYLEHVIAAFGPERCLWGSDWPVVNTRADLPAWIAAFRAILAGFSPAEQAAMAHGTAERVYGVRPPAAGEA